MSSCGYGEQKWNGSSVAALGFELDPGISWIRSSVNLSGNDANIASFRQQIQANGTWFIGSSLSYSVAQRPSLYPVEYCLSETRGVSYCQLQFVWYTLLIVVACNLVKVICMSLVAYHLWDLNEPILATIGDCVTSFLERPDETTAGWCLLDLAFIDAWSENLVHYYENFAYERSPKCRLYRSTTRARWWCTMCLCTSYLMLGLLLFCTSLPLGTGDVATDMKVKFGAVDGNLLLGYSGSSGGGLVADILIANSFQLALSTTYFLYNSLYTAQWGALEWASFIQGERRSLRVTRPRGNQRSTYYLQLP